jgi:hypothetical protein
LAHKHKWELISTCFRDFVRAEMSLRIFTISKLGLSSCQQLALGREYHPILGGKQHSTNDMTTSPYVSVSIPKSPPTLRTIDNDTARTFCPVVVPLIDETGLFGIVFRARIPGFLDLGFPHVSECLYTLQYGTPHHTETLVA